jgi:hypothetical protein
MKQLFPHTSIDAHESWYILPFHNNIREAVSLLDCSIDWHGSKKAYFG